VISNPSPLGSSPDFSVIPVSLEEMSTLANFFERFRLTYIRSDEAPSIS